MWDEASRRQLIRGELRWEAALTYSYAHHYQDALKIIEPLRQQNSKDPKLLLFSGQLNSTRSTGARRPIIFPLTWN